MLHEMDDTEKSTRTCLFCNWMIQFRLPFQRLNIQQLIKHKDLRFEIHPLMETEFSPFIKIIEQKYSIP